MSRRALTITLALLLAAIYGPLIATSPILGRDDTLLLDPLLAARGIGGLWDHMRSAANPDLQPLRDLSLYLDVVIERASGIRTLHLQNVLIFWLSCLAFAAILARLGGIRAGARIEGARLWLTLAFAVHPLFAMSVGWISARKHLLAFLFLLLALNAYLDWRKEKKQAGEWPRAAIAMLGFYLLSVLAQPIHVFLPLWWWLDTALREGQRGLRARLPWLAAGVACACWLVLANHAHYAALYGVSGAKRDAIRVLAFTPIGDSLLALGRYTWSIFVPFGYSHTYARESPQNLAGIVLLVILLFAAAKRIGARELLAWASLALASLALVLTKIPDLFSSDTYALGPAFAAFAIAFLAWGRLNVRGYRAYAAIAAIALLALSARLESRGWASDLALWENAYKREPDCLPSSNYAVALLRHGQITAAAVPARFHVARQCKGSVGEDLLDFSIFRDGAMERSERARILQNRPGQSALRALLLAALEAEGGDEKKAVASVEALHVADPRAIPDLADAQVAVVTKALRGACAAAPGPGCRALLETMRIRLSAEAQRELF